jgi:hypothetical protein
LGSARAAVPRLRSASIKASTVLAAMSTAQVREILARLMALRPTYSAINDDLLLLLGEQL